MKNTKNGNRNPVKGGKRHNNREMTLLQKAESGWLVKCPKPENFQEAKQTLREFYLENHAFGDWFEINVMSRVTGIHLWELLEMADEGAVKCEICDVTLLNIHDLHREISILAALEKEVAE